jgi:hypothetical protein
VRRSGKIVLCQSLAEIEYLDCKLPSVLRQLEDPERFLRRHSGRPLALDEIHRLPDPANWLKIAADHFPNTRIVATGSSALAIQSRIRDALTGRKAEVWLTPMNHADLDAFASLNEQALEHRLLRGGLPGFFLGGEPGSVSYREWIEDFWARDLIEHIRLDRRFAFLRLFDLLAQQSGGIFEATRLARPCEVSRTTIQTYLRVLETMLLATVVRPFASHPTREIVSAPKVYLFDTGFVCHAQGFASLRPRDAGVLWEHYVLNELQSCAGEWSPHYWRDKQQHEVDLVLTRPGARPLAVECKWSPGAFEPRGLAAFLRLYPESEAAVVCPFLSSREFEKEIAGRAVRFLELPGLIRRLTTAS